MTQPQFRKNRLTSNQKVGSLSSTNNGVQPAQGFGTIKEGVPRAGTIKAKPKKTPVS